MLRVWKPKSPMNLGAWMLSLFSAAEGVSFLQSAGADNRLGPFSSVASRLPARPAEIAGLPLSVFMTAYTGVLLAGTSAPVWNQSPLLGATFLTSSFASAVDALNLEYALRDITDSKVERQLKIIGLSAKSAEAILIASHIKRSGRAGKPLWSGLRGIQLFAGLALEFSALFLPKLRKQLPPAPRLVRSTEPRDGRGAARRARIVAALVGLAGAFLIRWAFVHAGSDAADDIEASHAASQPTVSAPGWR
jgi:formate-dependent nitrite reductase membrane component NrfD